MIALEKAALDNMARVSGRIQRAIEQGQVIYGLTTGVGDLVTTRLSPDRMTDTQLNMLRSHACGVGPDLTVREVRAMMAVTLKSLLQGYSGVTPALADRLAGADLLFFDGTLWTDDEILKAGLGRKTGQRMGHISMSGPEGAMAALDGLAMQLLEQHARKRKQLLALLRDGYALV